MKLRDVRNLIKTRPYTLCDQFGLTKIISVTGEHVRERALSTGTIYVTKYRHYEADFAKRPYLFVSEETAKKEYPELFI